MNLLDALENIATTSTLKKLPTGTAKDFDDLWTNLIEPRLPQKAAVEGWHKLLIDYVNKHDAVFTLRAFGSKSKKQKSVVLRRGFYNTTNYGFSAFYVDNFFTAYFYSMALDGYVPTLAEFEDAMHRRQFPCGSSLTPSERVYAAYLRGKSVGISTKGYKIAHIFSAGQDYHSSSPYHSIGDCCSAVFPRGVNTDWSATDTDAYGTYHNRKVTIPAANAKGVRDFLVAHFLRTIHPINYFLVPNKINTRDEATGILKTNIYWDDGGIERNEIGENPQLIEYVAAKIKAKYGVIYDEFLSYIYPNSCLAPVAVNKVINARYGIDLWMTKIGTPTASVVTKIHTSATVSAAPKSRTPRGGNEDIVFRIIKGLIVKGSLSSTLLSNLTNSKFSGDAFNMPTYPILISVGDFAKSGFERRRFYKNTIFIGGVEYLVCSQWIPVRISKLKDWYNDVIAKSDLGSLKIGKYARLIFTNLLTSGLLSLEQMDNLQDRDYCNDVLDVNYPILTGAAKYDKSRYYTPPVGAYAITNDWYEPHHRTYIDTWLEDNGFTI